MKYYKIYDIVLAQNKTGSKDIRILKFSGRVDKWKGLDTEYMSKKDTVTKAFMRENTVFADAFNYLSFNGEKVIQPEQLQEFDTTELAQQINSGQ